MFRRRLIPLLILTYLLSAVAFVALDRRPVQYRSEALIEVTSGSIAEQVIAQTQNYDEPERRVATEIEVLESRPVAQAATADLSPSLDDVSVDEAAAAVTAVPRGTSNYIEVAGRASSPETAQELTEAFVTAYFDYRRDVQRDELAALEVELQEQLTGAVAALTALGPKDAAESEAEARDRAVAEERVSTSAALLEEVRLRLAVETSAVRLLSGASLPEDPEGRLPMPVLAVLSVIGAFLVALGLVLALEALRDRVRTRQEAERLTRLPVLAELPRDPGPGKRGSAARLRAARSLRLRLMGRMGSRSTPRLLVAGVQGGDADALATSVDLASSCSETGQRVLLVADAVWPSESTSEPAQRAEDRGKPVQVGSVLAHPVNDLPGVWCCRATTSGRAVGLLDSERPADVLARLAEHVDVIVFVATYEGGAEAAAVLHLVPDTVVVVGLGRTRGRQLRSFTRSLEEAGGTLQGLVLTAPRRRGDARQLRRADEDGRLAQPAGRSRLPRPGGHDDAGPAAAGPASVAAVVDGRAAPEVHRG